MSHTLRVNGAVPASPSVEAPVSGRATWPAPATFSCCASRPEPARHALPTAELALLMRAGSSEIRVASALRLSLNTMENHRKEPASQLMLLLRREPSTDADATASLVKA
jgi:hypothetical protein